MAKSSRLLSVPVLLAAFLTPATATAQVTSTIQGRISDPSGAVIAAAAVRATNEATGIVRSSEAANDGYYRIPDLLPGIYDLRVEQSGFKTLFRKGIEVRSQ